MTRNGSDGVRTPSEDSQGRKSASTVIVDLAESMYRFGLSDAGETFAVPRSGAKVVVLLRGGRQSLRAQLAREYFRRTGKAAPQQALADALMVIEGIAQESDEEHVLHLRVARYADALWLDLADATGRAIRITAAGWTIEDKAPVLFKRTALNAALPTPIKGGSLDVLWLMLNVELDDRPLILAAVVASFYPDMPHPVIALNGEQGTGKTTAMKVITLIVDPSPVPARKAPRDAESWVTAAAGSWFVGLDNLSEIQPWLSDSICRAVTGEGDVRRKLYTDGDLAVFSFRRCVVLSGIDFGALRGDLADRMLPIGLYTIDDTARVDEEQMWLRWEQLHPRILGALLDLLAGIEGVLPSVKLTTKPRMADFAKVLAATDMVLGTTGLATYLSKQSTMAVDSLEGVDFIVMAKTAIVGTFAGTSAELLKRVTPADEWRAPKGWPGNARAVTRLLRQQAPVMRKAGWTVTDDGGINHDKITTWTISPPETVCNLDPRDPQTRKKPDSAGLAGLAGQEYGPSHDDHDHIDLVDYERDYPDLFESSL
ncbi:MAG: ATP-binding protein [Acidimicrobiales bacterium]